MAKKHGICEDWYLQLKNEKDVDSMLEMAIKGIDFCLSNDFPSNDFIRKNFKGKMEHYGIHLDEVLNLVSEKKVVALGACTGIIEVKDYDVCEVFVKHNSKVKIMANENAFVMVDLFDGAEIEVYSDDNATVCINRYGGTIIDKSQGESRIKIIEKNKKTY